MSGIGNNYNSRWDYSGMYSSNSNNASNGLFGISLTDYASIRNGSYRKLLKATYAQQDAQEKKTQSAVDSKNLTTMKTGAEALKNSTSALTNHKLWEKKTIKEKNEETGEITEKKDYDWGAITEAVKQFVSDYNTVIGNAGSSDTNSILRNATNMIKTTEANSKLLEKVGIKIGSDNKLTLDEDKLKSASISTLKTLFEGNGSYADRINQKAGNMGRAATKATDTYNREGKYTNSAASAILAGNTSGTESVGNSGKAVYKISDEMKSAILDQIKLDYYMYGGSKGTTDSKSYQTKLNDYLKSLDSKDRTAAANTITKLREELSNQIDKQIKAQLPGWNAGNRVANRVLDKVFANTDDLMKNAESVIYNGSVNLGI